ncbi:ubiquinone anaerobic biosynthesis accessory factor UbiT [Jeongeupia naejangsanensis]|uniref:SCP2 sterol-binding domain-containing protein n=1 Tax=Jeongeupia naejangsanensis TaxID=613195 RepID=A0ABS2BJH4_9NEIS|nr:SCP2 sterol-binding domain-containing protein [Jeongeupia naejangsanensis]MBM3115756.1 SCP2 sterol-binding domain-containing protein [Jeongeupia naejangsanensis]
MTLTGMLFPLLRHLPEAPPSRTLAFALNLVRRRLWPDEDFGWLADKRIRFEVADMGRGVTIGFSGIRFRGEAPPADVTFTASFADYWAIARRNADPDTLFFQRRLTISGDTELGLQLKNLLDATDWEPLLALLPFHPRTT